MNRALLKSTFTIGFLIMMMAVPVYGASVNKSVKIDSGAHSDGASSVNGSITVGDSAVVTGGLRTVNGTVRVGDQSQVESVATVNGSLKIGSGVRAEKLSTVNGAITVRDASVVDGTIEAVNGSITLGKGTEVTLDIENTNGDIRLEGAEVGGDLTTVNGDVDLTDGATLRGDLNVEEPSRWGWNKEERRNPRITIGPGSKVEGTLRLEREVDVYLSDSASIGGISGAVDMDDVVRFSGDRP